MNLRRRSHGKRAAFSGSGEPRAFTLVELLLAVALLLLLSGAVILNLGALDSNARLEEGASHVETLFRYARAQAANKGRQVRIVFGSGTPGAGAVVSSTNSSSSVSSPKPGVQILWEPDPIEAPGRFEAFPGAELLLDQVNDLVKVQEIVQPGAGPSQDASLALDNLDLFLQPGDTNGLAEVGGTAVSAPGLTCYPDGTSDSMEVVLAAAGGEDKRLVVVTLWGLSGASGHKVIAAAADGDTLTGDFGSTESWLDQ